MAAGPAARPAGRGPALRWIVVLAVLAVAAWVGWQWYEARLGAGRLFASGTIQATEVDISPQVAGRIIRLSVEEGDTVRAGQVVAELEPAEAGAQVAAAEAAVRQADTNVAGAQAAVTSQAEATNAQVAQANAQVGAAGTAVPQAETALAIQERTYQNAVTQAQAQVRAAGAQVRAARSALGTARSNLAREKALFAQGAVAAQDVDTVQTAYDTAAAQMQSATDTETQAQAALGSAEANLRQVAIQREAVAAARANLAQAQAGLRNAQSGYAVLAQRRQALAGAVAALAQARENLKYLQVIAGHNVIVSPRNAVVQVKNVEQGEVVAPGTVLYTLIDLSDIWLRAYVPQDQIGRVKVGQAANVTVDSFPGRTFAGRVTEISSKGEFTPGNVQTRGDRVTLVFGVKIQLPNADRSLKPGLPADTEILVGSSAGTGQDPASR
jgi:HlyD family secretion protein